MLDDGFDITLPWPPSLNSIWRSTNGRVFTSREVKQYYRNALIMFGGKNIQPMEGRLTVFIHVYQPDKRRRDLDNILKVPMDALKKIGVYKDDSQIDESHVYRKEISKTNPRLVINIMEI